MTDDKVERGAAEEGSGTPVTPTEVDASRKPPSQEGGRDDKEPAGKGEQASEG
nr:hypothetical protein [uncultured Actinoplanes sp.]